MVFVFMACAAMPAVPQTLAGPQSRAGDFSMTIQPTFRLTSGQGGNLWWLIELTSLNGFNSEITLTAENVPANTNYWFYPDKVTPVANSKVSAFLRVNTTATTPFGLMTLTIKGTNGATVHSVLGHAEILAGAYMTPEASPFELSAAPGDTVYFFIKLIACKGFWGSTPLWGPSDDGLGGTYSFEPVSPVQIPIDSIRMVKLSVTVPNGATAKTYNLLVSGMSQPININWSIGVRVRVVPADSISVAGRPWMQTIAPGDSATFSFDVSAHGTFSAKSDMSLDMAIPSDITTSFWPSSVTPAVGGKNTTTLTITTSDTTVPGIYLIAGKATSGAVSDKDIVYLWVTSTPDFSVRGTPSSRSTQTLSMVNYSIILSSLNGFAGDVDLSVQSPPDKSTVTLSTNKVSLENEGVTNVLLNITPGGTTPLGRYAIRVVASTATLMHYIDLELVVAASMPIDFRFDALTPSRTAVNLKCDPYKFSARSMNNWAGDVALSVEGVPTGTTASFDYPTLSVSAGTTRFANLTLTPTGTTPFGAFTLRIYGENKTASLRHEAEIVMRILPAPGVAITSKETPITVLSGSWSVATLRVNGTHGFSGPVDFSKVTMPAGYDATFTPGTVVTNGETVMNLSVAADVLPGIHDVAFFASNLTTQFPCVLQVNVQNFSLGAEGISVLIGTDKVATVNGTAFGGFSGLVGLSVADIPAGVTVDSPAALTVEGTAQLTVHVGTNAVPGQYNMTITGSYHGVIRSTKLPVQIMNFSLLPEVTEIGLFPGETGSVRLDVLSVSGFSGTVQLAFTGPQLLTMSLSFSAVKAPGSTVLSIDVPMSMGYGEYTIKVNGTSNGQVRGANIKLRVHGFTIAPEPGTVVAEPGTMAKIMFNTSGIFGFSGAIKLSVAGVPAPIIFALAQPSVTAGGIVEAAIDVPIDMPSGNYTMTINGTNGTYSVKAPFVLRVVNITLIADPPYAFALVGETLDFKLWLSGSMSVQDKVDLKLESPFGGNATMSAYVLSLGQEANLTVMTSGFKSGKYELTISGNLIEPLVISITLQDFGLVVDPAQVTVIQGAKATAKITIKSIMGFNQPVDLSIEEAVLGITADINPMRIVGTQPAQITVQVSSTLAPGDYSYKILSAAPAYRFTYLSIKVNPGKPTFDLTVTPDILKIEIGKEGRYKLEVASLQTTKVTVNLDIQGLPSSATPQWTAQDKVVDATASLYLPIRVAKDAVPGKYNVTIIGTSGPYEVKRTVTLEIIKPKKVTSFMDNTFNVLLLLVGILVLMVAIGLVVYLMTRKRSRPGPEEELPPPTRSSSRTSDDIKYGRSRKAPRRPLSDPEPEVQPEEAAPYEPEPETSYEEVQAVEPQELEPIPESPNEPVYEPPPEDIPEPEPIEEPPAPIKVEPKIAKKPATKDSDDVDLDDILRKLQG